MASTVRPTKKQRQLLDYIEAFIAEHGYSPSYREIMNGCEYTSVATVALHVNSLIKRGHLRKRDHSARSLEVVRIDDADQGKAANADSHEAWLERQIQAYIQSSAEDTESDRSSDAQLLVGALHLLGLHNQADALEAKLLKPQEVSTAAEKAV